MTSIFNFFLIAGAVHGFIFNVATFLSRKKVEKTILFLNLFVFFLSLNNLQSWLIDKNFITSNYYTLPWYVLLAPMFHAFIIYYLRIEKKTKTYFILAAAVFFLELTTRSIMVYLVQRGTLAESHMEFYNAVEDAVTLLFSIFLFRKVLQILFKYEQLYINILAYDDLKWIKRLIQIGGVVLFFWLVAVFLNFVSETIKPPYSYYPLRFSTSVFIYWIGYQGFFRYVVLQDRIILRGAIKEMKPLEIKSIVKIEDSKKIKKQEKVFNDINAHILNNQNFLDPDISLEKVSKEVNIGSSQLSMLINQYGKNNFSDYINRLRVDQAKELLGDDSFRAYTIVAIGLECGFNSKSTFYTAFKKFTSQTPTQFRNRRSS